MTGRIYVALVGDLVKIGHTTRAVGDRIRQHRQFYRRPVRLLHSEVGTAADERAVHASLAGYRVRRAGPNGNPPELFAIPPEVLLGLLSGKI